MRDRFYLLILFSFCFLVKGFSQSTEIVYLSGKDASSTVDWDFFFERRGDDSYPMILWFDFRGSK